MFGTISIIILVYFITVFGLLRLIIPHMGFGNEEMPAEIPIDMKKMIDELKVKAGSPRDFLELAYDFVGSRYRSERFSTIIKFNYLFFTLDRIWRMSGYIPCTQSSYILRIFLIKSGFFREEEIKRKHFFVNFIVHQYLQVKVNGEWVDVDVGEKQNGMKIGNHLKYFG